MCRSGVWPLYSAEPSPIVKGKQEWTSRGKWKAENQRHEQHLVPLRDVTGGPTFSEGRESAPCAESQVFTCRNRRLVVEERTQPKQHYMNADVSYGRLHVAFVVAKLALTGDRSSSVGIW